MCNCSICKNPLSSVLMNNRWVCLKCDELLFDIEIESDQQEISKVQTVLTQSKSTSLTQKTTGQK